MSGPDSRLDTVDLYALFWRWLSLAVHRYGSAPTGELLVVITMILLDRFGYQPTVTELADITQLPKSSISRYVAAEMQLGMLEEFIDPGDRRRRRLRPTELALAEQPWHAAQFSKMYEEVRSIAGEQEGQQVMPSTGVEMVKLLKRLNRELVSAAKNSSNSAA